MKNWNAPVVEELNVNMTANGMFNTETETLFLMNDSKKSKEDEKTPDPES